MKLVTSIYQISDIDNLIDSIDYALISVPHMSLNYKDIDIDLAIKLLKEKNKGVILSINRIMQPTEFDNVISLINKYKNTDLLFYTADLGVLSILKKEGLINRAIYNPETMITNYLDLNEYYSLGCNACGVSAEITLKDLKLMHEKTNAKIFYQVFGRRLMFYSRRHLISLYEEKNNDKYPHEAYLREATRSDFMPIIENDECTTIYRPYNICLLDKLKELDFIEYAYVEGLYLDESKLKAINMAFYNVIKNNEDINLNMKKIEELNLDIEDGFFYKDSVYQKEELKNV